MKEYYGLVVAQIENRLPLVVDQWFCGLGTHRTALLYKKLSVNDLSKREFLRDVFGIKNVVTSYFLLFPCCNVPCIYDYAKYAFQNFQSIRELVKIIIDGTCSIHVSIWGVS